jgi:hypothetical protein
MPEPHATVSLRAGSEQFEQYIETHPEPTLVIADIARHDVEAGKPGDLVDRLMVLSESKANVQRFASSLAIQFSGYDDDPRELYEIPETVAYFRQVTELWPHWFHFGAKIGDTLAVVIRQLIDGEKITAGGQTGFRVLDPNEPRHTILRLVEAMNVMYRHFDIGLDETKKMTDAVIAAIAPFLQGAPK